MYAQYLVSKCKAETTGGTSKHDEAEAKWNSPNSILPYQTLAQRSRKSSVTIQHQRNIARHSQIKKPIFGREMGLRTNGWLTLSVSI